jgi:hypothetical protein
MVGPSAETKNEAPVDSASSNGDISRLNERSDLSEDPQSRSAAHLAADPTAQPAQSPQIFRQSRGNASLIARPKEFDAENPLSKGF